MISKRGEGKKASASVRQTSAESSPEEMAAFFERRLDGYEEHQLLAIQGAQEFYPFTAKLLPAAADAEVLDLGCGTGLELRYYYAVNAAARLTCIDLSQKMLDVLQKKYAAFSPRTVCGNYFAMDLGRDRYDAAVSVESMHHFTYEEKVFLYRKIFFALRKGGRFVLTDYLEKDPAAERVGQEAKERTIRQYGIADGRLYHIDAPLTAEHEMQALTEAGFERVEEVGRWQNTSILVAYRGCEG